MKLIFDTIIPFIINNIGIIISILALILSVFNFIYLITTNMKKLKLKVENYSYCNVDGKKFYFFNVMFSNNSRLPIAINEIDLLQNKKVYHFIKSKRLLLDGQTTRNKQIIRTKKVYSAKFPININGLCSEQYFIVMYGPDNIDNSNLKIILRTNRGKIKMKFKNFNNLNIDLQTFFKDLKNY